MPALDWQGVLTGQPLQWILSGFLTTLWVTLAGMLLASLLALLFMLLRLSGGRPGNAVVSSWVSLFRNTPLLVQLLFWYFAAWNGLPQAFRDAVNAVVSSWVSLFRNTPLLVQLLFWYFAAWNGLPQAFRDAVNADHSWSILPGDVWWFTPEFLCSAWGLGVFTSAFLIEEVESGLRSVPAGQREAALAQGFSAWRLFRYILLPQGLANAWQPVVGQYLNLMKLSSLASGIGFAELTYQVRQIESYNAHALEAFTLGTALYLLTGLVMGLVLVRIGPDAKRKRPCVATTGSEKHDCRT